MSLLKIRWNHQEYNFTINDPQITIGRADQNILQFKDVKISRFHCQINRTPMGYLLSDSGSSNGTFLNGNKIQRTMLHNNDFVKIGNIEIIFMDNEVAPPPAPARPPESAPTKSAPAPAAATTPDRKITPPPMPKAKLALPPRSKPMILTHPKGENISDADSTVIIKEPVEEPDIDAAVPAPPAKPSALPTRKAAPPPNTQAQKKTTMPALAQKQARTTILPPAPAAEEQAPEEPKPEVKPKPTPKPLIKGETPLPMPAAKNKLKTSNLSTLNKNKPTAAKTAEDDGQKGNEVDKEFEIRLKKAKEKKKKFLYIGGGVLAAILLTLYVVHSSAEAKKMAEINKNANELIVEINELLRKKDYSEALDKCQSYVTKFKEFNLPDLKSVETNIENLGKTIEKENEGKAQLKELLNKKNSASAEQYEELLKEFRRFSGRFNEFNALADQADKEMKDLNQKIADAEKEKDDKIFNDLMTEIQPLVDEGKIDAAIANVKEFYDKAKDLSPPLQKRIKKKMSELKAQK